EDRILLHLQVFLHGFNDEVTVLQRTEVLDIGNCRKSLIGFGLAKLDLLLWSRFPLLELEPRNQGIQQLPASLLPGLAGSKPLRILIGSLGVSEFATGHQRIQQLSKRRKT